MESLSFSFFRIPKAFLVRFFNPEKKEEAKGELLYEKTTKTRLKGEVGGSIKGYVGSTVLQLSNTED